MAGASHTDERGGTAAVAMGEKKRTHSKAQPLRPEIVVLPRGIGPVHLLNRNDVLSGRGGRINLHVGNVQCRHMVQQRKGEHLNRGTRKLEKAHIAAEIVQQIRNMDPPGRFLKEDASGIWCDIGDAKAISKVGQASSVPIFPKHFFWVEHERRQPNGAKRANENLPLQQQYLLTVQHLTCALVKLPRRLRPPFQTTQSIVLQPTR
jgi:hypothetical protein